VRRSSLHPGPSCIYRCPVAESTTTVAVRGEEES
jgi:hypothetical protein